LVAVPYVSKLAEERAKWMTLREAVAHIKAADRVSRRAAWDQLREAIGDQTVAVRWADVTLEPSTMLEGHYVEEDDVPPTSRQFWKLALIKFAGGGRVLDDPACRGSSVRLRLIREGTLHYRPLLVRREPVERLWPRLDKGAEESSPTDQIRDTEHSSSLLDTAVIPRTIDREEVDEKVRQLIRGMQTEHALAIPNLNESWDLLKDKLPPGVTRKRLFDILKEPEFAQMRVKRGQRKRRK
jgi:hypothetical protein